MPPKTDHSDALPDATQFARRVRQRIGLTQMQFSRRIEVALDTIRNWSKSSAARPALQRRAGRCKAV